jgi:hypothetical protein
MPASGYAVERQFSISGRMTIWQRNRWSLKVISDVMITIQGRSCTYQMLVVGGT